MAFVYWFICSRSAYPVVVPTVASSQGNFNRQVANATAGLRNSRHAVGDLLARPVSNAIKDHLLCDGSAVARVSFPQLFAEIGTEWGEGDGTTTFNLPSLIGAALPTAPVAPEQVITDSTVSTGGTITGPAATGQTGGSTGGNITTGGRPRSLSLDIPLE